LRSFPWQKVFCSNEVTARSCRCSVSAAQSLATPHRLLLQAISFRAIFKYRGSHTFLFGWSSINLRILTNLYEYIPEGKLAEGQGGIRDKCKLLGKWGVGLLPTIAAIVWQRLTALRHLSLLMRVLSNSRAISLRAWALVMDYSFMTKSTLIGNELL